MSFSTYLFSNFEEHREYHEEFDLCLLKKTMLSSIQCIVQGLILLWNSSLHTYGHWIRFAYSLSTFELPCWKSYSTGSTSSIVTEQCVLKWRKWRKPNIWWKRHRKVSWYGMYFHLWMPLCRTILELESVGMHTMCVDSFSSFLACVIDGWTRPISESNNVWTSNKTLPH